MNVFKDMQTPLVVSLVTTVDAKGRPNASPKTWWTPVSYEPPLLIMALKPTSHTALNIGETGVWCLHLPDARIAEQTLHTAKPLPAGENELDDVELSWEWLENDKLPRPVPHVIGLPFLVCWVSSMWQTGDHNLFVGHVGIAGGFDKEEGVPQVLLHRGRNHFVGMGPEFDVKEYT